MTVPGFILRNALRNKRRSILTLLSVAVSLFLLVTLQTALRELTVPPEGEDSALRLAVRHKVSLANVLPRKYQRRIESLPGVRHAMPFSWFGGIYIEMKNFFPQFACDPKLISSVFSELRVPPDQIAAFQRERTACVVGKWTAERFGFKVGDRVKIRGDIFPVDLDLMVRGIYTGGIDETNLFFHHDYLDELMDDWGRVGTFWVRAETADDVPRLIVQIDRMFQNSGAETKTETERAFQLGFVSMLGNVRLFIGSICTAIVLTMLLVTAGTMNMAIRERQREIAVLKALGFDAWHLLGLIVSESFLLSFAGGLLGCLGAVTLFSNVNIYELTSGMMPRFDVTPHIIAQGLLVAAGLGLLSCMAPAWNCLRLTVAEGLRTLD